VIPYLSPPVIELGPLRIHAFGILVAAAVFVGMAIGARRFRRLGLDGELGERFAWWVILGGFLGAHLFAVIFYFPEKLVADPLVLVRVWEDISSFGGILGGAVGMWLFFRFRAPALAPATKWAYVDVAAFVFPISLMIGRLGCALAHDHPGYVTDFPLAISLRSPEAQAFIQRVYASAGALAELPSRSALAHLGFHDLGWYEFLYLAAVVVPVVVLVGRSARSPGRILGVCVLLYMPVRFLLDFLRIGDVRYAGLTPAQWAALGALFVLAVVAARRRSHGEAGPSQLRAPTA
jgi:phosphatidylglycerol:prolipoprotein diacylglycerol transferase